jgi:hypothetical protein
MTEDELAKQCIAKIYAFAKRMQAEGLREAANHIDEAYELNRIELRDWCLNEAKERENEK